MATPVSHGRVLVVENDARRLSGLIALVVGAGYQAIGARTGADALAVLRTGGIDLVVLPRGLPDMTCNDLRRQIRDDVRDLSVAVLAAADSSNQLLADIDDLLRVRRHHDQDAARWRLLADVAITVARCRTYDETVEALARVFRCELDTDDVAFYELADGAWSLRASTGGARWDAVACLVKQLSVTPRVALARVGEHETIVLPIRSCGQLRGALCVTSSGFDRRAERMLREVNDHLSNVIANVESWQVEPSVESRTLPTTKLRRIVPAN